METLFRCLSVLPLWLLHAGGFVIGWVSFCASATYRRRFLANAAQAGYRFTDVWGAVGASGQLIAELPRLWLGAPVRTTWQGKEHIERAHATGRSIVFLTPHMGCFEITPQAYARSFAGNADKATHDAVDSGTSRSITVLYRKARKAWLHNLVDSARNREGLAAAPADLAGVKQLLRAVKKGQAVGILPDQVPPDGMGEWLPFFDKPAYTMTLAARLAMQPNAVVLLAWGERLSWGRGYRVHVQPAECIGGVESGGRDLSATATQINQAMEQLIRQCPQQYLWGYARYKKGRK